MVTLNLIQLNFAINSNYMKTIVCDECFCFVLCFCGHAYYDFITTPYVSVLAVWSITIAQKLQPVERD